uniref:Uncharacterized protein n=1 Tax=Anguilla anguilla TaxID=7936 RepID=A0A0E9R675_ANGAN
MTHKDLVLLGSPCTGVKYENRLFVVLTP